MKNRIWLNRKICKIVPIALLTIMLLSAIASAELEVQTSQQDDNVKFIVKNVGKSSTYLLNALTLLDEKGDILYISQDPLSAEVLKMGPGISYQFDVDAGNMPEGRYIAKVYQGDNVKSLGAKIIDFQMQKRPGKPVLYADKKLYKSGKDVDITFRNMGFGTIYVNVNNWNISNLDTGEVVNTLSQDCTFGYGGCADLFKPLGFMKKIKQTWDQKDNNGNQVPPGSYKVTAEYSNDPSGSDSKMISTQTFFIRPPRK